MTRRWETRRWQWCIPVVATVALAGCGAGSSPSSSPTTVRSHPATTTPATTPATTVGAPATTAAPATTTAPAAPAATTAPAATGPSTCTSAALHASLSGANGAAGSVYYELDFLNTASTSCVAQGYPGVSFVAGADGHQVGAAASRTSGSAPQFVLNPGAVAEAQLRIVNAANYSNCGLTDVLGLRVYPPGQTAALFVPHRDQGCSDTSKVTLFISPLRSAS
jgi:hypothetical protein